MNKLAHLAEFETVLADYHISPAGRRILKSTKFVLLSGPTSSGRNTIIRELLKTGSYYFIVSDTTRRPRINDGHLEEDGVVYWFRSEEEVLADLKAGKYLEAEIIHNQQVSGISIRELEKARELQKIAITDIEIGGFQKVAEAKPDAYPIFILPPSFDEWQRRIKGRGHMSKKEFRNRLETAAKVFATALEHNKQYHFVINRTLEDAVEQIHELVVLGLIDKFVQLHARRLVEKLYLETKAFLNTAQPIRQV